MEKKKFTAFEKLTILQEIKRGLIGIKAAARKFGVTKNSIVKWRRRYQLYGDEGLEVRSHNQKYSVEFKLQAVRDYLEGELSQNQIIYKYKIASTTQLANWIKKYNGHSNSLTAHSGGTRAMTYFQGISSWIHWPANQRSPLNCPTFGGVQETVDHHLGGLVSEKRETNNSKDLAALLV